ncbi:CHAT domain-containing protein [Calothrix sp. PCC 7507]|uniref:CHAT domain-containing protein n=1 Tax=Calothrix sp. PCC 7507 TaxID=99598 RepID=UPI00029F3691|nr:tetratricopeptide repeat protein [Calothrix sp. PCC 7507]AFY31878.1 Tetratricopeptide TPR_1 repeat-containing protein [Calothrix sp. PCC 7507]
MLRRLFRWLKKWLQRFFGSQQAYALYAARRGKVVDSLPELSNADLELLFNELLEGVHQARGKQWALRYLQRMENRITEKRWIDWLRIFGEKLLTSPAPNHLLATRMVQLGELGVGRVGELSYDIGIRLLTRNLATQYQENEPEQIEVEITASDESLHNTPGQELIRNLGERLWDYEEQDAEIIPSVPKLAAVEETWTGNLGTLSDYEEEPAEVNTTPEAHLIPSEEDAIANLFDLFREPEAESADYYAIPPAPEEELETAALTDSHTLPAEEDDDAIAHLFDLLREPDAADDYTIPAAPEEELETTTLANSHTPPVEEENDDAIAHLFDLLREPDDSYTIPPENSLTPPVAATWDASLEQLEPKVAGTLDELLVRLDQSTNLVQELATELAVHRSSPTVIVQHQTDRAQSLFYQGLQQARSGDLLGAIAFYDQAIELKPHSDEYWFNRGLTLFHLEQFTEAIASYDQAVALKPDFYKAWYNRGGILGELGQFEAAIASFEQAIIIKPDSSESWASKGLALLKLGQLWEAIAAYDQALVLQPEDQENWYYRGIALAVSEQHEEAIASYDKALEIQPDYHEVWIDRGVVLFNLKRWSEAIASWDHALSIQADFYLAWYNRGIALDNLGQREEAIDSYRKAIAIKPDFHLAWYNQAVALFYLGRFAEAIASYDRALQIKLDYWEAWIGRGTAAGNLVHTDDLSSLLTTVTATNPALKLSGYAGKIASYEEGLKHVRPDTHPEGWGRLHLAIANTYCDRGRKYPTSRNDWQKALAEYNQALLTITREDFPLLHLEVLQSLIKVHLGLGQTPQAQELQQYGIELLQQLLGEPTRTDDSKKQLALKCAGFGQLAVDLAVDYGDLVEAWEIAEQGKNACITWLLFGWHEEIYSPNFESVQELLNPTTAIIYWHISPTALHTFILKDGTPSPILLFTPIQDVGAIHLGKAPMRPQELPLPEAVRRLIAFEDWLEDWHQQYQEYGNQSQDKQNNIHHSWRVDMEQKLLQLKDILNIATIEQELEGITQLVLIPHRELHRVPLHTLFQLSSYSSYGELPYESNFTFTYLPSVQVALTLKTEPEWHKQQQLLLNIEYPHSANYPPLKFAKLQSEIVSQMFTNSQSILGSQANKNIVENALFDNYHILHFMGHVINNYSEPKKSQLLLADEDKLSLEEICQQTLVSYHLATLPACEITSNSNHNVNSEYVSIVTGLLTRGVSHVVSTLWTVESFANALVMIEFYRRLQPDKSAATALAEATTWLKELTAVELTKWYEDLLNHLDADELRIRAYVATQLYRSSKMPPNQKLYSHPYYWAAFIIAGK